MFGINLFYLLEKNNTQQLKLNHSIILNIKMKIF